MFSKSLLLFLPALWSVAGGVEPARTVIIVRHAERSGGMGNEVGISAAGRCRAEVLAGMLADAGVKAIFTSEVSRTQQTAEPLAKRLNLHPEPIAAKDIEGLATKLRAMPNGSTALVVGHSNTVPEVISKLGGGSVTPIADADFDRMFVVTLVGSQAIVTALHYQGCALP